MKKNKNLNACELIKRKENEYIQELMCFKLEDIFDMLEIDSDSVEFNDLRSLSESLHNMFAENLLEDDDFLAINVCSHFKMSGGTHIFGLSLLDVYECPHCNENHSVWYAFVVNTESEEFGFGICQCNDSNSVTNSPFRGKPMYDLIEYIFEFNGEL